MRRSALFFVFLTVAAPLFAQVQSVGDVSFAVPDGWTYQGAANGGAMILKQGANFWVISVHASRPTTGNAAADFKAAWRSEILTIQGFERSLPGYDPYDFNKSLGYPGKEYSGNSDNGQMYIRLYTLETGRVVVPITVIAPNRQAIDFMEHIAWAVVGSVRVAPLQASPIRTSISMADLAGDWKSGMATSQTYYNRYTGAYAGSTQTFYGAEYHISGNRFTYGLAGMMNSQVVRDSDEGTVQLGEGGYINFVGRRYNRRFRFINAQTAIDGSTVLMLLSAEADQPGVNIAARQEDWTRPARK